MQVSEWMIGVGIALLGGYTAWMTRISVGLSRIERMQEDMHSVWAAAALVHLMAAVTGHQ